MKQARSAIWLSAGSLLAAACQGGTADAPANKAAVASGNAAAPGNAAADAPDRRTALELRLNGGGLAAGQPGLHSSATYAFGMPRAEIVAAVAAIRGPATGTDRNGECGAGPMEFTRFGALTLNFQEGRWVGWDLSEAGTPPLRTEQDLGIGTARDNLADEDRDPPAIEQTTLGTEFTVDEVHGLLSGAGPRATVTHLSAGTDCAFR